MSNDRFKFRAWDKSLGKIVTNFFIDEGYVWSGGIDVTEYFILMQSTNRKDKSGKLIFESDILACKYTKLVISEEYEDISGKTIYKNSVVSWRDRMWIFSEGGISAKEVEIIGNIHENPELLEEKDNG